MTHLCYVSEYSSEGLFDFRSILGIHNIDGIERCKLIQRMGKYHLAIFFQEQIIHVVLMPTLL